MCLPFSPLLAIQLHEDLSLIHRQNVEVKNADGKKRRWTKRRKKKRRMGQNVEWKKR
jgi:hypothetical protein